LLDTNVLSALRKPRLYPKVAAWLGSLPSSEIRVSVITFGEIRRGIELKTLADPSQGRVLDQWYRRMVPFYGTKILGIDLTIAETWGSLGTHQSLAPADGWIAATALVHDLTVATRNITDFQPHGVKVFNPF
jgi:toxin FitB